MPEALVACRPKDCSPEMQKILDDMVEKFDFQYQFLYTDNQEIDPRMLKKVMILQSDGLYDEKALSEARMLAEANATIENVRMGDHDGDRALASNHYDRRVPHLQRGGYLGRSRKGKH